MLGRVVTATVEHWNDDEGWGVLTSPDVSGSMWAHFSAIDAQGYRSLNDGEQVQLDWEHTPHGQDGYFYRATRITRSPEHQDSGTV